MFRIIEGEKEGNKRLKKFFFFIKVLKYILVNVKLKIQKKILQKLVLDNKLFIFTDQKQIANFLKKIHNSL